MGLGLPVPGGVPGLGMALSITRRALGAAALRQEARGRGDSAPGLDFAHRNVDMGPLWAARPSSGLPIGAGLDGDLPRGSVSTNGAALPRSSLDIVHVDAARARALPHDPAGSLALRRLAPDEAGAERARCRSARTATGRPTRVVRNWNKVEARRFGETLEKLRLRIVSGQGADGYREYRPLGLRRGPGDAPSPGRVAERPRPPRPVEAAIAAAATDPAGARRGRRPIDFRSRDQSHLTFATCRHPALPVLARPDDSVRHVAGLRPVAGAWRATFLFGVLIHFSELDPQHQRRGLRREGADR